MSISPLSSIANLANTNSSSQTPSFRQSFRQLEQALASGNLSGAQAAYNSLSQKTANTPFAAPASSTAPANPLNQDLNAIGQALKAGNLTQAQQSFGQLVSDFKAQSATNQTTAASTTPAVHGHHGGHHHHSGDGDSTTQSASGITSTTSSPTSTANSINVLA